ncbi:MAG: hypothetical protein JKX84_09410 [Flavobacteriales bacterium]|nr:hypothetical protein [Flavobacteriales bacterium]
MKTREEFHKLIDTIEDDVVLKAYYQLVSVLKKQKNGHLWNSLAADEQDELLVSYEESMKEENLVRHNVVMEKHLKWRKK